MSKGAANAVTGQAHAVHYDTPNADFAQVPTIRSFVRPWKYLVLGAENAPAIAVNWVVSVAGALMLFAFVLSSLVMDGCNDDQDKLTHCRAQGEFKSWQRWITQNFTWLYIGTQDVWIIFILFIAFSKYGTLKLGKRDEQPEFSNLSWFAMLFACGIGSGIWYWGASEPIYYYRGSGALDKIGFDNDDERAQQAMNVTYFHWGIHGWVCYIIIAVLLSFVCYRWDKPMTMRMCFFPLIGNHVYGLVGDFIDAISIACTTFGVCTSLGLGVFLIHSGIVRLHCSDKNGVPTFPCKIPTVGDAATDWQVGIIWIITAIATASVISGLHRGIKWLSVFTFLLGCFVLLALLLLDNTWFILNSFVQNVGYYFQYIIQIGAETDSWQQLSYEFKTAGDARLQSTMDGFDYAEDAGNANQLWGSVGTLYDKVTSATGKGMNNPTSFYDSHNKQWMDWWTIFYWGWWISWGPFVGTFIAKISRGRTIRQVVVGAFMAPTIYTFFWQAVYGGLAIKMQRTAELALLPSDAREKGLLNYAKGKVDCSAMNYSGKQPVEGSPAYALASAGYYALSCRESADRIWDVMMSYGEVWKFLVVIGLISVVLYFITSSDSGSYIDDLLSAGGLEHPPVAQKVFWCFTEGACATALLVSGGSAALGALQSVSIVAGMPYTFVICFACTSLWEACRMDYQEEDLLANQGDFTTHVLDVFEMMEMRQLGGPNAMARLTSLVVGTFAPFVAVFRAVNKMFENNKISGALTNIVIACFFLLWPILHIAAAAKDDEKNKKTTSTMGWVFYLMFCLIVAAVRSGVRTAKKINGSLISDFFTTMMMYPMVCSQLMLDDFSTSNGVNSLPGGV